MWEGYLSLGGQEILNSARVYGYTLSAGCPVRLLREKPHDSIHLAFGDDVGYTVTDMESAPWYDPDDEATRRFYGAYPLSMVGADDSTASATTQERVSAGGVIGRTREASREVRVRAMLVAEGEDALSAGLTWLKAALATRSCTVHSDVQASCGLTDSLMFVAEPPGHTADETVEEYRARVARLHRRMHSVKRVSGPLIESKRSTLGGRVFMYVVTFVIASELPWVFSDSTMVNLPPVAPLVMQDAPFNLVPQPSAELSDGDVIASVQFASNPSSEVDSTDWNVTVEAVSGANPAPYFTQGRVTNELQAVGVSSVRGRILGNGATEASGRARITIYHEMDLTGAPANSRMSFNIWGAVVNVGGTTGYAVQTITATAFWRTSSAAISSTVIGTATAPGDAGGRPYSVNSVLRPNNATRVRVALVFIVDWRSSATPTQNNDIRAYADAIGATIP